MDGRIKSGHDEFVALIPTKLRDLAAGLREFLPLASRSRKIKGAGKAGCPLHPQPRVENEKPREHSHHRFAGITQPSLRNGFNGYFVLSPGDRACLPPSPAK
jgi:hypothetical protein